MKRFLLANKNCLPGKFHPVPVLRSVIFFIAVLSFGIQLKAQGNDPQKEAGYKKVVTERVAKIVNVLELKDSGVYDKVLNEIVGQYIQVNTIHDQNKMAVTEKKQQSLSGDELAQAVKQLEEKKLSRLLQLHAVFIAHLKESLTTEQIEKIKDGMTYRVFPITYAAYLDMLPQLTGAQKDQIYAWLKEARELAMDEGSSDDKHKVFGKYKGRINNYLSAAGYDMKKEGEEWQKRIKEREKASNNKGQ